MRGPRTTVRNAATASKAAAMVAPASHPFLVLRFSVAEEGWFLALLSGAARLV